MKSLNKHVPVLVFLLGLSCMVYSMLTFFHSGEEPQIKTVKLPPGAGEIFTPTARVANRPAKAPPLEPQWGKQLAEQMHKVTDAYLRETGLVIKLPEGMQYAASQDGSAQTLIGVEPTGRIALYLISGRGNFSARDYLQDLLKDQNVKLEAKGVPYNSRTGLTLYVYKGAAAQGFEYLAYLFKSAESQHAFVLVDKSLGKHPAAVHEMVESIRFSR